MRLQGGGGGFGAQQGSGVGFGAQQQQMADDDMDL